MIFRKTLLRELTAAAIGIFVVLLGITLTTQLVRLLGQAASGLITTTGVVALLGLTMVNYLPVLLSLTLFIAVLLTLTRGYRDSEMVVWFSCGPAFAGYPDLRQGHRDQPGSGLRHGQARRFCGDCRFERGARGACRTDRGFARRAT
jgi:hypothetical protein